MANLFLDYEGGNDSNNGSSFALRFKTMTAGATAARIAPGDVVRLMASPDPTSLGVNGTWTNGPQQPTVAIAGSTNATPIVVTSATQFAAGDTVIVNAHTTNTKANGVWEVGASGGSAGAYTASLLNADGTNSVGNGVGGASGTIRLANNLRVKLASAVTANVALNGNQGTKTNWTSAGGANIVPTIITTDGKEGGECLSIQVVSTFTTGMAAYFPTGTLDLSAYQQLSFRIKQTVGTIPAAAALTLRLCSDTAGVTTVDTFNIPSTVATGQWIAFTVDKGSALGSAIASIAFDVNTDNGAQTFLLDNIIACKAASAADSLSNTSLIGKNTAGETWCAIQSINGTRVMLDAHTNSRPTTGASLQRGYSGTTETVTAYKRETIKVAMQTTATATGLDFILQDSGTDGNPITFSGGWNRTDMSTQTGETWLDGQNGFGGGIVGTKNFVALPKINLVRFNYGIYGTLSTYFTFEDLQSNNNASRGIYSNQCIELSGTVKSLSYNGSEGLSSTVLDRSNLTIAAADGNLSLGVGVAGKRNDYTVTQARNNGVYGFQFTETAADCVVRGISTSGNLTSGGRIGGSFNAAGTNYLVGANLGEAAEVSTLAFGDARLWSKDHDGTPGNDICFTDGAKISAETTVRHTASGRAWKIDITSTTRSANYPLDFEVLRLAVAANAEVTVTAWMRRTNTGITHQLVCEGGQLAGIPSDVVSAMTAAADTWEQLTLNMTPTEAGVLSLKTRTFGGSTFSAFVDDLGRSQA